MFKRIRRFFRRLFGESGSILRRNLRRAARRVKTLEKELGELRKARKAVSEGESVFKGKSKKKLMDIYKELIQKKVKELKEAKKDLDRLKDMQVSYNTNSKKINKELDSLEKRFGGELA